MSMRAEFILQLIDTQISDHIGEFETEKQEALEKIKGIQLDLLAAKRTLKSLAHFSDKMREVTSLREARGKAIEEYLKLTK